MSIPRGVTIVLAATLLAGTGGHAAADNLLADPSFEVTKPRDQFGLVFARWGGWKYEGDCEFRVGEVARTGKHSCLLYGGSGPKIRASQNLDLRPGRYRMTAYLRGLDISRGNYNMTTEFMFAGKFHPLNKNGTFGWTKLTYVADLDKPAKAGPSFGLMAPGYFWIDDVTLEEAEGVPLTPKPVLGDEESPIAPPGELASDAVRCADCGYRNNLSWKTCYACGAALAAAPVTVGGPKVRTIADFDGTNAFSGGTIVASPTGTGKALQIAGNAFAVIDRSQDWRGYDFLKAELDTAAAKPLPLYIEVRDAATKDYWTRVNYTTVAPPGKSTLVIPLKRLYVGEKSRPGRMLDLGRITRLVVSVNGPSPEPLVVDNVRLERDDELDRVRFDGLYAYDFGIPASPVMEGFQAVTPATLYSAGRGYGLKDARVWRAMDALQPDPLYQDFICIEQGGLAVDLPDGRYRVFLNMDSPSGFWGEYQRYRRRTVRAEGRVVVDERQDFESFRRKYFRFWNVEDLPSEVTFDKYQVPYFHEKQFEVEVRDGQLNLEFKGEDMGCSVSAVVIYPLEKRAQGEKFLEYVKARRRFYFDIDFKRVLPTPRGGPLQPGPEDESRGFVLFHRDVMDDIASVDTPAAGESFHGLEGEAFAGELEPLTLAVTPLRDLGTVTVAMGELKGPDGSIPAEAVELGSVSYRLTRVTPEGSVYTISPRLIMPGGSASMPAGITRRFWLTVHTPAQARPGTYRGTLSVNSEKGGSAQVPVAFRVRAGTLDPVDIPVGPFGYSIGIPWYGDDPAAARYGRRMMELGLRRLRDYGFTMVTGMPVVRFRGFKVGQPTLDYSIADPPMKLARDLGFLAVGSYGGGVAGFGGYAQDTNAMRAAGFSDYASFVKAVYSRIQRHADQQGWLPVYYNLADEPIGGELVRAAENAEAYRNAFPEGPPFFTGASSFQGTKSDDPHFRLSRALHVVSWNLHDEPGVRLLRDAGGDWAFYNGGNRWTFGTYMYKAVHQFGMKFRVSWHWNIVAGDPYYALDCREDDYAWCNASPDGRLIPSVEFERLREGLDDYRRLITLERLIKANPDAPASREARALVEARLKAFSLGQRDHSILFPPGHWTDFRGKLDDAIERLRAGGK